MRLNPYEKIFNGSGKIYVEFYDYSINETEEMFFAVGWERGSLIIGGQTIKLNIRTSRIFKKLNGIWKQIHHHGSIDNSRLLENYQTIILRKELNYSDENIFKFDLTERGIKWKC